MESKKINQLATELSPALSDLTIIGDPNTGISKKITLSQMASLFTGTVEEYANLASFPLVGVADTIYIALDTNVLYRWDTGLTSYVELSPNIINSLVFNDANGFDGTISLVGSVATLTITTALTTGSVGFIGASGALTQDNSNYYWDNTNKRLGIGTNAPTTAIDVFGSGIIGRVNGTSTNNAFLGFASAGSNKWSIGNVQSDHRFRIYNEAATSELFTILPTGEIGIGIANPFANLHIDGGASVNRVIMDANINVAKIFSFRSDNSQRWAFRVDGTESGSNAGADFAIRRYSDAGAFIDTPFFIKRSTSFIGLGTTSPSTLLHLNATTTQLTLQNTDGGTNAERIGMFMTSSDSFKIISLNDNNTTRVDNILCINVLDGSVGIGISSPETLLHLSKSSAGGEGAYIFIDNPAASTLGNKAGIKFANDTGASFSGYSSSIESINTDASTGAAALTFSTWNGTSRDERVRIAATGAATFGNSLTISQGGYTFGTGLNLINWQFVQGADNGLYLAYSGSQKFSMSSAGATIFSSGIGIGGATATTGGIQFPATEVASANANNLDDYEEGTWTMGMNFSGGSVGITLGNSAGKYTKIGRQVTVTGYLSVSNKGSSVGDMRITGLPFTIFDNNANYSAGVLWLGQVSYVGSIYSIANKNSTQLEFHQMTEAGVRTTITNSNIANNSDIIVSCTYYTT
jgi:hypothetical protein